MARSSSPAPDAVTDRTVWLRRWRRQAAAAAAAVAEWACRRWVLAALQAAQAEARLALTRRRVGELEWEVIRLRRQLTEVLPGDGGAGETLAGSVAEAIAQERWRAEDRALAAAADRLVALSALAAGPAWAELVARVRRIARRACPAVVGAGHPVAARLWAETLAALQALDGRRLLELEAQARRLRVPLPRDPRALVRWVERAAQTARRSAPRARGSAPVRRDLEPLRAAREARWQRRLAALADEREWWAAALALARNAGDP